jgi:hypothetical protein
LRRKPALVHQAAARHQWGHPMWSMKAANGWPHQHLILADHSFGEIQEIGQKRFKWFHE